jgi:hypothetical protein
MPNMNEVDPTAHALAYVQTAYQKLSTEIRQNQKNDFFPTTTVLSRIRLHYKYERVKLVLSLKRAKQLPHTSLYIYVRTRESWRHSTLTTAH